MLNLEWVVKKLLPSVVARTPIGKPKAAQQPQQSSLSAATSTPSTPQDAPASPPQHTLQGISNNSPGAQPQQQQQSNTDSNDNSNNPYRGPNPESVVPPQVFVAILDEALAVLRGSNFPAVPEVCIADPCYADEELMLRAASEEVLGSGTSSTNNNNNVSTAPPSRLDSGHIEQQQQEPKHDEEQAAAAVHEPPKPPPPPRTESSSKRKAIIIGPTRGHAVTLARVLLKCLSNGQMPNFIFLGDFIDSGPCSVECLSIVLALMVAYHRERNKIQVLQQQHLQQSQEQANVSATSAAHSPSSSALVSPSIHPIRGGPVVPLVNPLNMNDIATTTAAAASLSNGPIAVLLRGRHESNFPAPVKWTGSPLAGYRRLDDELNSMFGAHLDNTAHSLVAALTKIRTVFAWLPVAAVLRCRVREGEQTAFLCTPGGPSPALLRHKTLDEMKAAIEGAVHRYLRAPLMNNNNNNNSGASSPFMRALGRQDSEIEAGGPSPTNNNAPAATTSSSSGSSREKKRLTPDEQLLKDLATADPYEDDEDRAATTAGILFSDNPDSSRDPGMCCFSTEAAATMLARCGAHCLFRGNGYSMTKIAVPKPQSSQQTKSEQQQLHRRSSSSLSVKSMSSTVNSQQAQQQQQAKQEMTYVTGRPRASPYDPGFRMYRLPSHVKRAVQSGGMPGSQASPIMSSSGSMNDLTAAFGPAADALLGGGMANSNSNSVGESATNTPSRNRAKSFPQPANSGKNDDNDAKKKKAAASDAAGFKPLPQVVSLFSAPHFGNNFKSRNIGCVAVVQCGEDEDQYNLNKQQEQQAAQDDQDEVLARIANRTADMHRRRRGVLVSMVQFDDPEPLLFTPADQAESRLREIQDRPPAETAASVLEDGDDGQSPPQPLDLGESTAALAESVATLNGTTNSGRSHLDDIQLDEADLGVLSRLRRLCNALKDKGQLQVLKNGLYDHKRKERVVATGQDC